MRAVVVGASSGLGRCIANGLAARGAQVAYMARRRDRLVDAAAAAGGGAVAIGCDATDPDSAKAAIDEAASAFGGIDALVYAPGVGELVRLKDATVAQWQRSFEVNVLGAALVTAAAVSHLEASKGAAAYLTSVSASMTPPWPGLGTYGVTKAALDKLVEAWRAEHPQVGFTRVVVGDCAGGEGDAVVEFANGWDPELAAELYPGWLAKGCMAGSLMDVEVLVDVVHTVLRSGATASIPSVAVTPRPPG